LPDGKEEERLMDDARLQAAQEEFMKHHWDIHPSGFSVATEKQGLLARTQRRLT
jgi:hypothetical protein